MGSETYRMSLLGVTALGYYSLLLALWKRFLNVLHKCWMPFLFLVAFSKLRQDSVQREGMQRSFLWPQCLSGENTILGFPQAVCMIPGGTDHKDFKGILGPGEEMKSSPLPLTLCVHQPGDLGARLTGDSRCKQEGPISKSLGNSYSRTQIRGWGFDLQQKDSFALFCRVHSTPRNKIQRDQGNNFQLKDAGIPFALSARKAETELTLRPIIKPP